MSSLEFLIVKWKTLMEPNEKYQEPMQPWPGLQAFSKKAAVFNGELDLFYFESGRGNPHSLILVHGLGDEADTWRHIFVPLAQKYHILAVDLPGFGRSELPDDKITPVFLLDLFNELLEETGIDQAILVGNSLGGILSHAFTLKKPDRVEGLVLVDGALLQNEPMGDFSLLLMEIPLLGEWLYKRLRKDPQAAYDSLRNVYCALDALPEDDRDFLFTRVNQRVWSETQRKAYFSTLRNLTPWIKDWQSRLPGQLEHLHTPTLIIRGEHDTLFSEKNARGIEKIQPNASLFQISEAGHLPHQEKPGSFLSVLETWLEVNYS